jgi:fatty-acyl-CoA synthase
MPAPPEPGLAALLDGWAAATPAAPALIYEDRALCFAELAAESRRVAGGLAALGVAPGDRVAVWLPNVPAWLVLLTACARLGVVVVALNTRFRSAEIGDILGRSGARLLVMWPGFKGIDFAGILAGVPTADLAALETVIAYGEGEAASAAVPGRRVLAYGDLARASPVAREPGGGGSPALVFTTSGTTRAPKFVLHSQASLAAHAADVAHGFGYDARGFVSLLALPLCGTFGLAQALATLAAGRPAVLQRVFDAGEAAGLIRRNRVVSFNATDEMLARLFAAGDGERPFPSLAWVGFAAFNAAITDLMAAAERRGVVLAGLWGASEMQALYARQRLDGGPDERGVAGGFPVAGTARFRIRDPETGALLPPGAAGELETTGPSRMLGYWGDEAATAAALSADGFVRMGDLAFERPDGSFVFLTRLGDVLRLGGYLVAPAEIEAQLQAHPAVAEAQVVGALGPDGPRAVGFVIPRPGAGFDEAALRAHCAAVLARYKVPERILRLDAFPMTRSANGEKIQRARLREMATAAL